MPFASSNHNFLRVDNMDLDRVIRGSLARLAGDFVAESAVLREFQAHGLSSADSLMALEKALLEGYLARAGHGDLIKLARAQGVEDPGTAP
ncbi:MAG: hypothetical protein EOP35_20740 [Rubrivivax sp.]|nr:MAG: hypothetical protein EOP35_20740 [Rubrivivax sp.]